MLEVFMGQCALAATFLPISSLNETTSLRDGDDAFDLETIDLVVDPTPGVDELLAQAQADSLIHKFVANLSPLMRCVVIRHFWLSHSQSDIAADLGVTRSAVCHALARAYRQGRKNLAALA